MEIGNWDTKQDFQGLMLEMVNPLKSWYTKEKAGIKLGVTATNYDRRAVEMEAFARPLWGLSPFFAGGGREEWFAECCRQGITAGTDPESEEYWGTPGECDQRFVEMTAMAYAILMAPETFWDPLSSDEKAQIAQYLYQINLHEIPRCNWYMFRVLVNVCLKKAGYRFDGEKLEEALEEIESYYLGQGWYKDGVSEQKDYYISFAIHFYSLIYARFMETDDLERVKKFKGRAIEFARQFICWFDEDGAALPFGRSLTYRFAQASFFSACLVSETYPFSLAVMKGILVRHLKYWLSLPIFDRDGILTIGYGYPNLMMAEKYNGPGSPYWCLKVFAFLALPDEHPFWKTEAAPYPDQNKICLMKYADMLVRCYPHHHTAFVPGKFSPSGHGHSVEKYGKFAYDTKFAFSIARSCYEIYENCPDSMLAFYLNGYVYVRKMSVAFEICPDRIWSRWSPRRGIMVETEIIPTNTGHIRKHIIESKYICEAYDCGFSVGINEEEENCSLLEREGYSQAKSGIGFCSVEGQGGDGIVIRADPNTNLVYPKSVIPSVKYRILAGRTEIKTEVTAEIYK